MRKKILIWLYFQIESLFTKGIVKFHKLAFRVAEEDRFFGVHDSDTNQVISVGDNVGIIITTLEERFEVYALPLISTLRKSISNPIFLVVNANYDGPASSWSSRKLIEGLAAFENVFPIFFGQMQGCASLWNTGIKHSNCEANFILNDDISVNRNTIAEEMQIAVNLLKTESLITINKSWSHFLISNKCLDEIGYFDERFLGFGDEDIDYIRRIIKKTGNEPANIFLLGFINLVDQGKEEKVAGGKWGKYSLFNQCLSQLKYPEEKLAGALPATRNLDTFPQDFEFSTIRKFRNQLYPMLLSKDPDDVTASILRFYSEEN